MFRSSIATLRQCALAVALSFIIPGCVSSRAFVPAEHVTAFSPEGDHTAAEYSLLESGRERGEVKVWSDGAQRDGSDAEPRTVVRVSFEVVNNGSSALRFDSRELYIEELPKQGKKPGRARASGIEGDLIVPPGKRHEITASFSLPGSVWPGDLPGYRVAWSVVGEQRHERTTPFLQAIESGYANPWYGSYYSPYYYGYYPYGYYPYGYYPGFYGSWSLGYRVGPGVGVGVGRSHYAPRWYAAPRRR